MLAQIESPLLQIFLVRKEHSPDCGMHSGYLCDLDLVSSHALIVLAHNESPLPQTSFGVD